MSAIARSVQTDEKFLLVQEDVAHSIAFHLFQSVCDLMKEREVERLTSGLSEAQEELFSKRIAERKSLTEGVSNSYQVQHYREAWVQIETLGYREWKTLEDSANAERITAILEKQKRAAANSATA
jgi:hypothetical protein